MKNVIALEPNGNTLVTVVCGTSKDIDGKDIDGPTKEFSLSPNRLGPFRLLIAEEVDLLGLDKTREVVTADGKTETYPVQYATIEATRAAAGWKLA